ncbi:uncharacterized protein LOC109429238 [Aedes albopictus]|uniref:Secreted protein n=1 Tax=Aedes albopictus TaxID=7160 RepID=A0ABM1YDZ9_AEDAL|nr:uncharacterized protein LOC109429238 [Aedes albopictus]
MSGGIIFILTVATIFGGVIQAAPPDAATVGLLLFRERCVNVSGSDEGFYQLFRSFEPAKACLFEHVGEFQQEPLPPIDDYESRKEFFDRVCPKINESVSCFEDVIGGAAKCTTETPEKLVTIISDILHGLVNLICRDRGQLYYGIKSAEFGECLGQVKANVIRCRASEATRTISSVPYSMEQCQDIFESRDCIKGICSSSTMDQIMDEIYGKLLSATKCTNDV